MAHCESQDTIILSADGEVSTDQDLRISDPE